MKRDYDLNLDIILINFPPNYKKLKKINIKIVAEQEKEREIDMTNSSVDYLD